MHKQYTIHMPSSEQSLFFFFNDTATTEIYTLSLHDALPISAFATLPHRVPVRRQGRSSTSARTASSWGSTPARTRFSRDRKSTRLNSSHLVISYAVFCLKKKNEHIIIK